MRRAPEARRACASAGLLLAACATGGVEFRTWQAVGDAEWHLGATGIEAGPAEATGYLVSIERYRDFTMTFEFRVDDGTNSGVFVRCRDPLRITPADCYEINIWDNHPRQEYRTGSIVMRQSPFAHVDTLGRWNTCRIDVRGSSISVSINDVATAELEDDSLGEGHIALQYGGIGVVRFRDVRLYTD